MGLEELSLYAGLIFLFFMMMLFTFLGIRLLGTYERLFQNHHENSQSTEEIAGTLLDAINDANKLAEDRARKRVRTRGENNGHIELPQKRAPTSDEIIQAAYDELARQQSQ